jgi:hypothetical protein
MSESPKYLILVTGTPDWNDDDGYIHVYVTDIVQRIRRKHDAATTSTTTTASSTVPIHIVAVVPNTTCELHTALHALARRYSWPFRLILKFNDKNNQVIQSCRYALIVYGTPRAGGVWWRHHYLRQSNPQHVDTLVDHERFHLDSTFQKPKEWIDNTLTLLPPQTHFTHFILVLPPYVPRQFDGVTAFTSAPSAPSAPKTHSALGYGIGGDSDDDDDTKMIVEPPIADMNVELFTTHEPEPESEQEPDEASFRAPYVPYAERRKNQYAERWGYHKEHSFYD